MTASNVVSSVIPTRMLKSKNSVVKKSHRLKNNLLCDDTQYIHYLSATENGHMHDKKIADQYPLLLPVGSVLRQDLGFIGHAPSGVLIEQPFKKPPKGSLSFSEQLYNQLFTPMRVVIEHANSGIKRLRIIKDVIRIHDAWFRDTVMVVACALHNFRVTSSLRDYPIPSCVTINNLSQ